MVCEWHHIKMLKPAARGHNPAGTAATKEGELAVLCPACPQPGINLPEGWEDASPHLRCVVVFLPVLRLTEGLNTDGCIDFFSVLMQISG